MVRWRELTTHQIGDGGDTFADAPFVDVAEAEDELGWVGELVGSLGAHSVQAYAAGAGGGDHGALVDVRWEMRDGVEAGRESGDGDLRRMVGEGSDESAAAGGVDAAHASQVTVEATRFDQAGEGELVDAGAAAVAAGLLRSKVVDHSWRAENPAEAQGRGQGLADRAEGEDVLGSEALDDADGLTVVAELGIVVILDDPAAVAAGPVDQSVSAVGGQHDARGPLMGGREKHSVGAATVQDVDIKAVVVDRNRDEVGAGPSGGGNRGFVVAGIFDSDQAHTAIDKGPQHQVQALGEPGAHDQPVGVGGGAAYPVQVAGEHGAQPGLASGVAVAEDFVRCVTEDVADRPRPVAAGEAGEVGRGGNEVGPQRRCVRPGRSIRFGSDRRRLNRGGRGSPGDPGRGADLRGQIALGRQLGEALLDQAAGDPQAGGQLAGGRDAFPGGEPSRADRVAQAVLELDPQRSASIKDQQQLRTQTGPLNGHRIGSYRGPLGGHSVTVMTATALTAGPTAAASTAAYTTDLPTTTTDPHSSSGSQSRLLSWPLVKVLTADFAAMCSFYLLLSAVPMYLEAAGAGTVGAGLSTGVMMFASVAAGMATPRLSVLVGHRWALAIGLVLLGVPALALPLSTSLAAVAAVCVVRGVGFAVVLTAVGTLTTELLPADRRGEGLGLMGVVSSVPAVVALPLGVALVPSLGFTGVFVAGAAMAAVALVAAMAVKPPAAPAAETALVGMIAGFRRPALVGPAVVFGVTALAGGVVVSFLPAAVGHGGGAAVVAVALLVRSLLATFTRWLAGRLADRHGADRLLVAGLVVSAAGMLALVFVGHAAGVLAGMVLFGAGFGVSQTASLAIMVDRAGSTGVVTANAMWNIAYDLGWGVGAVAFGFLVAPVGYPVAFAVTAVVMLAALPFTRRNSIS